MGIATSWPLTKSDLGNVPSHESYFVEIDGIVKYEYPVFIRDFPSHLGLLSTTKATSIAGPERSEIK
jgi:hypothetical protein